MIASREGIDIRKVGSGNTGATNVFRSVGKKRGYQVLGLDVLKGFVPALASTLLIRQNVGPLEPATFAIVVGSVAVIGHCFSIFLNFKGGKGIATLLGCALGATPAVTIPACIVFVVALATTRFMSLSTIVAVWAGVLMAYKVPGVPPQVIPIFVVLAIFITVKHRSNIVRLCQGTERKFSLSNRDSEAQVSNGSDRAVADDQNAPPNPSNVAP